MPDSDPKVMARLRSLFREELDDQVALMTRELSTLKDEQASPGEKKLALQEVYRAVHSLKGAAGAVGLAEPEQRCHELEDTLANVRHSAEMLNATTVAQQVESTIWALDAWAASSVVMRGLPDSSLREAPPDTKRATPSKASDWGATDLVRVSSLALDRVLAASNAWLSQGQALAPDGGGFESAIDALEEFLTDEQEFAVPSVRARYVQAGRRLLANLRYRHREQALRRRTLERAINLRGTDVVHQLRQLRLQPVSHIMGAMEQAAQEVAKSEGKLVQFTLVGGGAEADYAVLERLREPLLQLVRNAVAHGIETPEERSRVGKPTTGVLEISVTAHGAELSIRVSDDGRGIALSLLREAARERGAHVPEQPSELELLQLVCTPGVSSRKTVDRQAGRGIGMDLVRDRVERLQGRMKLESREGAGTLVRLEVPVDLTLLEALLIGAGDELFMLPTTFVRQVRRLTRQDVTFVEGSPFVRHGELLIRLTDFRMAFEKARQSLKHEASTACVIVNTGGDLAAYAAEAFISVGQYVVKPLNDRAKVPLAQAAVVLPDGTVAPLLNAPALRERTAPSGVDWAPQEVEGARDPTRVLVVDDSVTTRQLVRILLEAAGYLVELAADGEQAWGLLRSGTPFEAIVSDIEMPRMGGLELLAKVRASARFRELPVILVTALQRDEDKRRALELGADAYVVKSRFDQQKLLDVLQELTG